MFQSFLLFRLPCPLKYSEGTFNNVNNLSYCAKFSHIKNKDEWNKFKKLKILTFNHT